VRRKDPPETALPFRKQLPLRGNIAILLRDKQVVVCLIDLRCNHVTLAGLYTIPQYGELRLGSLPSFSC
jgi:hypothetical protein